LHLGENKRGLKSAQELENRMLPTVRDVAAHVASWQFHSPGHPPSAPVAAHGEKCVQQAEEW